jgi:hypothetical protein
VSAAKIRAMSAAAMSLSLRPVALLLVVILSGCYSLGPLVTELRPAGLSPEGRPRVEVQTCHLGWGPFKQLQTEDCNVRIVELDAQATSKAKR